MFRQVGMSYYKYKGIVLIGLTQSNLEIRHSLARIFISFKETLVNHLDSYLNTFLHYRILKSKLLKCEPN